MYKLEVRNLTKIFGNNPKRGLKLISDGLSKEEILEKAGLTVGVKQANFSVKEGEVFVVMGLSGSGKSTLIRLINRLIEGNAGEVLIDGKDILKMNKKELIDIRRKKLGMVFQNFGLLPHRTVLTNVAYGLEVQDVNKEEREERAKKVLEEVGLKGYENSLPGELSGGMQQRVGLARALANNTDILLMDEAFSALDPIIRKDMQDELIRLQNRLNKTIVFITHDLDEALKLGDRIAIMKDGEIVQIGTAEEILQNPANDYVASFVQDVDRSNVLTAENIMKRTNTFKLNNSPLLAVKKMEREGISSIFIVDENDHYKGLLTVDDAIDGYKNEIPIKNLPLKKTHIVDPQEPLSNLIELAATASYPIAVVDNNKFVGIISRVSILTGLLLGKESELGEEVK